MAACALIEATNSGRVCQKKGPAGGVRAAPMGADATGESPSGRAKAAGRSEAFCVILGRTSFPGIAGALRHPRHIVAATFPHVVFGFGS